MSLVQNAAGHDAEDRSGAFEAVEERMEVRMRSLALVVALPATFAYAQAANPPAQSQPPAQPPAAAAAPATVEESASPELVGQLVNELALTPTQAQGAAGTFFGLAKTKMPAADFAKVAATVPNMDGLLKAAPADAKQSALEALAAKSAGNTGNISTTTMAATSLQKLGIKPETMVKIAPALVKAVQTKGGAEVASLLATALK
jgi:hypothetical protein